MGVVQELIGELRSKGWSKAALADELGVTWFTVTRWERGRLPANEVGVRMVLGQLLQRRRVPKRRRYNATNSNVQKLAEADQWNLYQSMAHGLLVRAWLLTGWGPVPGSIQWREQHGWKPVITELWLGRRDRHD